MSATVKINLAAWGAVIAVVVSVSGVLLGAGMLMAEQKTHRRDIDRNTQLVESLQGETKKDIDSLKGNTKKEIDSLKREIKQDLIRIKAEIKDQMRSDKGELLNAIRERP